MTFQIFNHRVLAIVLMMMVSVSIHAQQPTQTDMLNNVAKLKRIEAMQPDSIQPKYQLALQSLSFAVTYPHDPQTENMIAEAEQSITKMEQNPSRLPLHGAHCAESRSKRTALLHPRDGELRESPETQSRQPAGPTTATEVL